MSLKDQLADGMRKIIQKAGTPVNIKYFTLTYDDVYDDDVILTPSGTTLAISGIVRPINTQTGTYESLLVEQGKLTSQDQILYTDGSVLFHGSELQVKVGFNGEEYSVAPIGIIADGVESVNIYKKTYLTRLPVGSLIGE